MKEVSKEKLMTTREVAEQLGCTDRTIRDYASRLGFTKKWCKNVINGNSDYFDFR